MRSMVKRAIRFYWLLSVYYCVWTLVSTSNGEELNEGVHVIKVEHSISDLNGKFTFLPRGVISLYTNRLGIRAQYADADDLISAEKEAFEKAAQDPTSLYRIRTLSSYGPTNEKDYVMSFTKVCLMLESDLSDVITLSLDSSAQRIYSISVAPVVSTSGCSDYSDGLQLTARHFNTTVNVVDAIEGPTPETQAYLQKIEREKQERERGEQGDNRSFIAKYWMYLVPLVLFVLFSGAMNPEGRQ